MEINKGVCRRIQNAMAVRGLTPYDVSNKTGITTACIYYWIEGKRNPSINNLAAFCKALNVSADYILLGKKRERYLG